MIDKLKVYTIKKTWSRYFLGDSLLSGSRFFWGGHYFRGGRYFRDLLAATKNGRYFRGVATFGGSLLSELYGSTETALVKIVNDILLDMNRRHVSLLVLLDLSAAFDTVDHTILLRRLETSFGVTGDALKWIVSYLSARSQRVMINGVLSDRFDLSFGVPQGSCLGPLLFSACASKLFQVIKNHLPNAHAYADDTQLYLSFKPDSSMGETEARGALERCIRAVRAWLVVDKLKLNEDKSEFMLIGTRQQLSKVRTASLMVGDTQVKSGSEARNLGV